MRLVAWIRIPFIALMLDAVIAANAGDLRLIEAIKASDTSAIQALLNSSIDVRSQEGDGGTALHWAVYLGDENTSSNLIRLHANVDAQNDLGVTPLWLAAMNGNLRIVELLLNAGANPNLALASGATPLMGAARSGNVSVVKALLDHDATLNAREIRRGQTALMWAAAENHPKVTRLLLEHGADAGERSTEGYTPLLFAARSGDLDSAKYLVEAGAEVDEAAPDGRTPLLTASMSLVANSTGEFLLADPSEHESLALLLLERGADPKKADGYGITPLHAAVRTAKRKLVEALLARGADANARVHKRPHSVLFTDLPERNWDVGATPFHMAAKAANAELMHILGAAGADSRLATNNQTTPLMAAAGVGRAEGASSVSPESVLEAVNVALQLGSDVNAANNDGTTALHVAAMQGANSVIESLVRAGATLDVKDRLGRTPLSMAEGAKTETNTILIYRPETAKLLRKFGARIGLQETEGISPKAERSPRNE